MHRSETQEHIKLEPDLPSYLDPAFAFPHLSAAYEGFGLCITNLAAAASFGLRIPLHPLYFAGIGIGFLYLYVKVRETQLMFAAQRQLIVALKECFITENHYQYWSFSLPRMIKGQQILDIRTLVNSESAEKIANSLLGPCYQAICHHVDSFPADEASPLFKEMKRLRDRLELSIAAEGSQFNDTLLERTLNTACGKKLVPLSPLLELSRWSQLWFNVRKYYKSSLTGAATAGGLTAIIVGSALSTATLTALFPWSLFIILGAAVLGGIAGYILDKYFDRRKHKNTVQFNAALQLIKKNTRRVLNLLVQAVNTRDRIEQLSANMMPLAEPRNHESTVLTPLIEAEWSLPEIDYIEVSRLRQQSHRKRYFADLTLPTLMAARAGFGAISSILAGIGLAGLILPWWPVVIVGGVMLALFVGFKCINNRYHHISEAQRINDLNHIISPLKMKYWETELGNVKGQSIISYVKLNTIEQILIDLESQYNQFRALLLAFNPDDYESQLKKELLEIQRKELNVIHHELLLFYSASADSLNNKIPATTLAKLALSYTPEKQPAAQIITLEKQLKNFFAQVDQFILYNFKDIMQGAAFGFGTTLTIFAFMGITTLLTLSTFAITAAACVLGIALKLGIRYGIKATRRRLIETTDSAGYSISDREPLLDCMVATKNAQERVQNLLQKDRSLPLWKKPASRPLFWADHSGVDLDQAHDFAESHLEQNGRDIQFSESRTLLVQ